MQSILRWSIENSDPNVIRDGPPPERKELDPGVIDAILGKPDAVQMKEDMAVATDATKSEDERVDALDHLEMLIEQIDNANDLQKIGLWKPLHGLLTSDASTMEIKTQALWVIGTAVQNNPSAQDAYLSLDPLPTVLSFLSPYPNSSASRSKAIYTLSGLLKHNAPAVCQLGSGWVKLRDALKDPAISVRRKAIFLLATLLTPTSNSPVTRPLLIEGNPTPRQNTSSTGLALHTSDSHSASASESIHPNSHSANLKDPSRTETSRLTFDAFTAHGIADTVITSIVNPLPHGDDGENVEADLDYEEKAVRLLHTYAVACTGSLSREQKTALRDWIQSQKKQSGGEANLLERWSLTKEEYAQLIGKLL